MRAVRGRTNIIRRLLNNAPPIMRILFSLFIVTIITLSIPAHARMYQWVDAETGNVRLSGKPPAWYRSGEHGPRVLVFENGRLVDDTAVILAPEQRKAYREAAFLEVDLRREQDAVRKLERAALREARRRQEVKRELSAQVNQGSDAEEKSAIDDGNPPASAEPTSPEVIDGNMVEQLKAIISAWDRQNGSAPEP